MSENIPVIGWPVLVWLILSQLFYLVLLIPWGLASMMAVMAFDSAGQTHLNFLDKPKKLLYPCKKNGRKRHGREDFGRN